MREIFEGLGSGDNITSQVFIATGAAMIVVGTLALILGVKIAQSVPKEHRRTYHWAISRGQWQEAQEFVQENSASDWRRFVKLQKALNALVYLGAGLLVARLIGGWSTKKGWILSGTMI
jgi:hypothetical protein